MAKILVIEDDLDLATTLVDWLNFEHHTVELVYNGREGMDRLLCSKYDAVIMDWSLPEMTGIEILKRFRSDGGSTPVIMLTGKDALLEKEEGLDSGADDYVTKPFQLKELSARLRAVLRRPSEVQSNVLKVRDIEMDPGRYHVSRGGEEITLLPKEFALLEFLMRHPGQVFSAEALIQRVWLSDSEATGDAIRTCMKRLRKKLRDNTEGGDALIQTVHGVGYRLRS